MRLSQKEISSIKTNILNFDRNAKIYLFGSRTNDKAKGGDIDILVISDKIGIKEKTKKKNVIFKKIVEQKLELVVKKDFSDTFVKMIKQDLQSL